MAAKQPYKAEYAKSGRAKCKTCKMPIEHGSLRLAVMTQSPFHDGVQENWHHFTCFFGRARPRSVTDIARYESLRWEDQEKIRERIEGTIGSSTLAEEPKKAKGKKKANAVPNGISDIKDYIIEYAKSNRSKCKLCEQNIPKDDLRISKKDLESKIAVQHGPVEKWHHVDCFLKAREELGFTACGSSLPGFLALGPEEQKMIKSKIPALKKSKQDVVDGAAPSKKAKETKSSSKESSSKKSSSTVTQKQRPVLHGLKFFLHKTKDKSTDDVIKKIENLGGEVVKKYDSDIVAVISTEEEINKTRVLKAIRSAREDYIHVVDEDFFDNISPTSSREEFTRLLDEKKISGWGSK